jgi:hypothetical protein
MNAKICSTQTQSGGSTPDMEMPERRRKLGGCGLTQKFMYALENAAVKIFNLFESHSFTVRETRIASHWQANQTDIKSAEPLELCITSI